MMMMVMMGWLNGMRWCPRMKRRTNGNWWGALVALGGQYHIKHLQVTVDVDKLSTFQSQTIIKRREMHSIDGNLKEIRLRINC